MDIHNLFPIPIGMFSLGRPFTDEEMLFVRGQATRANQGNTTTVDTFVLRDPVMTPLRDWLEDCVGEYFKATKNPKGDAHLRITQSWFNYSQQGQWHHQHAHSNSLVSGVFYLNTNPDDRIYFYRPGWRWQQIKFSAADWNTYNSESWWFEAVTGRLILFPSSLDHGVHVVTGEDVRISMSFNTFPVGDVGDEQGLTGLKL